jgi:hypothetical protein
MAYLGNTTLFVTKDTYLGNVRERELSDTGVVSGTYGAGNGTQISVINVDAQGRITTASNVSLADGFTNAISPGTSGNVLTSSGTTWISSAPLDRGSGLFNSTITEAVGYLTTTSMATAYTAPSTAGLRYIIHSIHITNIGVVQASISGQFSGTTYSNISFSDTVPVPVGSSVELLKKPKVMQPNDLLQLQSSAASTLHATITIEALDDSNYFGGGVDVTSGATYFDLYTASSNSVIESLLLSNDSPSFDVLATAVWTNASNTIQGYFSFNLIVPRDSTVELFEQPKFIPNGSKIRVQANQPNRLEAIVAGKTI